MKFIHLADLHLGKRMNGFDLLEDQAFLLHSLPGLCRETGAAALVLAGDIYDTTVPPAGAVALFDGFLTECVQAGVTVLAISGNHDSAERLDYGHRLFAQSGVHIAGRFTGAPERVTLMDESGPVDFYLLPFVKAATVAHYLPDAAVTGQDSAVAAALAANAPDPGRRSVLVAHQFVTAGGGVPESAGSETALLNMGTLDQVDAARFDAYGYAALGHIHRPQQVGRPAVRYAGSPLCYAPEEAGAQKSAVLVELTADGAAHTTLLPLTPRRALRHLTGPLARLADPAVACDTEDYIWATLTDATPAQDAMARLRAVYPNALRLDYAAQDVPGAAQATARAVRAKDFFELFEDFFETMHGRPLSETERAEVAAMREEAGE